jgi:hypothetical protein
LGLLEAKSPGDYNSIGELRVAVYSWVQHIRKLKIGSVIPAGQNAVYNIEIETGDREHAGTDSTITIRITGTVYLDIWLIYFNLLGNSCYSKAQLMRKHHRVRGENQYLTVQ